MTEGGHVILDPSEISTHTLTWSVTYQMISCEIWRSISTHTLTWSVTIKSGTIEYTLEISTHTLTWSVTRSCAEMP